MASTSTNPKDASSRPKATHVPRSGIWAPAITFFDPETDTLALTEQAKYYTYLSQHLNGLVILGTNAETFLLTRKERKDLVTVAREAVGPNYPIMAGVSGHSTKQVLEFIQDAVEAGADYALVLPCAYFGTATSKQVIEKFYAEVAEKSPMPVVIYNFPGVCNGVDLDSDMITALAKRHENVVGVKLTCASVAKIARLAAVFGKEEFAIFGGQADFLIGGLASGSAGCIAAFANVCPKAISRIFALWQEGKAEEALKLHQKAALAERVCKAGIAGTKFAAGLTSAKSAEIQDAERLLAPRRPYEPVADAAKEGIRNILEEMAQIEDSL